MKFTLDNDKAHCKIAAVLGANGIWYKLDGRVVYLSKMGRVMEGESYSTLEGVLKAAADRKPVYEGDSVTIQF
jgi:hypothetical protein